MPQGSTNIVIPGGHAIAIKDVPSLGVFISITDAARTKSSDPNAVMRNWMRNLTTVQYLGAWEKKNNPEFDKKGFKQILEQSGDNTFSLTPKKWAEATNAIGFESKAGRYGGTFAHWDIAMHFMLWVSPKLKLSFLLQYRHRIEYEDALPLPEKTVSQKEINSLYFLSRANPLPKRKPKPIEWNAEMHQLEEADLLNMAVYGITQQQFKEKYPDTECLVHEGTDICLIVTHMFIGRRNEELISKGIPKEARFKVLNQEARECAAELFEMRNTERKSDSKQKKTRRRKPTKKRVG